MGRGDWALPKIERWAGRMCKRACLGTLMPLLVSNERGWIMTSGVWMDMVWAEGERERVTLVGLGEVWGS